MDSQSRWHFSSISTCQCSNKRSLRVAPTRVLQWLLANSMATTQSNVWTTKFTISMAKSPGTNPTRLEHDKIEKRAKRIQDKRWSSIHSCLRWRLTIHWTRQHRQWPFLSNSETIVVKTYRWAFNGANNLLPRERHYKQRWPLRNQPKQRIHSNNVGRSRHDNMQSSNNSRDGSKQDKQRRQWQHTRRQGRTCTVPTNRWEATMDDVYMTGPELCNKGTSTFLTTTNILGHEENEAYTTVSTRNKGLQVHTAPDDNSGRQRRTNTRRLRRCRLGRLHNNKEIHNRIRNQVPRSNNPFRIKNTSNRSTIKCRIGTILNRNGSARITPHPQFLDGNNTDKQTTDSNPRGLNKWQKHCNKNRIVKESKTYRFEVPFHTTIGTQRHTISAQDRYLGQHCRHIHKICHRRDSQQAPVPCWAFEPRQQLAPTVATVSQASKQTVSHPH